MNAENMTEMEIIQQIQALTAELQKRARQRAIEAERKAIQADLYPGRD